MVRPASFLHVEAGIFAVEIRFFCGKAMEDGIDALLEDDDIENVTLAIQVRHPICGSGVCERGCCSMLQPHWQDFRDLVPM